jgi:hypothetical protein
MHTADGWLHVRSLLQCKRLLDGCGLLQVHFAWLGTTSALLTMAVGSIVLWFG